MKKIKNILDAIKSCEIAMNYYKDKDETKYLYFKEAKEKLESNLINDPKVLKFIENLAGISYQNQMNKNEKEKINEEVSLEDLVKTTNLEIVSGNKHYF